MTSVQPLLGEQVVVTGHIKPAKAAAVLVALVGSFEFLRHQVHHAVLPDLDVRLMVSDPLGFKWYQWLQQPREYPEVDQVTDTEQNIRKHFYGMEMLLMFCAISTFVLLLPNLIQRFGFPCNKLWIDEVLPHLWQWTVYNEVIDWAAVAWLTIAHGVYLQAEFGLYWEDWLCLFSIVSFAPLAEFCFGYISVDKVALTVFPITSARIVRMKDKVQMFLFLQQGTAGIIAGLASALVIAMSQYMMLTYYPTDYVPSMFLVSIDSLVIARNQGTCAEWILETVKKQTRDGKVFFAFVHDLPLSGITATSMVILGSSGFLWTSLFLSMIKPICLSSGRFLVFLWLDEWSDLYLLQARIYHYLAKAAGMVYYIRGKIKLQIRQATKLLDAGKLPEAKKILEDVRQLSSMTLGERHQDTVMAMNKLANSLHAVGQTQEALALRQKKLSLKKDILGERHPDTISAMSKLADSFRALGQNQEALAMRQKVLTLRKDISGERHLDTIDAMNDLAISLRAVGQNHEALAISQEVLRLRRDILGERHPDTISAMSKLANSLRAVGRTQKALAMRQKVLSLRKEISGERHPDTIRAINNLANSLHAVGQTQEALAMRQKVLSLRKDILGERHPDTIDAMGNLAISFSALGQNHEALAMSQKVLILRRDILGERHPDTIRAMNDLAASLDAVGRTQEALALIQKVLSSSKDVLGERHPDTIKAMDNLASSLQAVGRTQEALAMSQEVLILKDFLAERQARLDAVGRT